MSSAHPSVPSAPNRAPYRRLLGALLCVLALAVESCAPPADPPEPDRRQGPIDEPAQRAPHRGAWQRRRPQPAPQPQPATTTTPAGPGQPRGGPTTTTTSAPTVPTPPSARGARPLGPVGSFRLLFADDFDGSSLGPAWYPNRWFATTCAPGAGTPEEQFYTPRPANVRVHGGSLHLVAQRETYSCGEWGGTKQYTSGWVQTGGSRDVGGVNRSPGFTCGVGCFVEARVRMPAGGMTFPAVWMLPVRPGTGGADASYPSRPEVDIVEFWDSWGSWEQHVHSVCGAGSIDEGHSHRGADASAGFHTVGLWWRSPSQLEWYVDGVRTWSYTGCGVPGAGEQMYVILNHAVGHAAPSPARSERFPKDMAVDYVRVWTG